MQWQPRKPMKPRALSAHNGVNKFSQNEVENEVENIQYVTIRRNKTQNTKKKNLMKFICKFFGQISYALKYS